MIATQIENNPTISTNINLMYKDFYSELPKFNSSTCLNPSNLFQKNQKLLEFITLVFYYLTPYQLSLFILSTLKPSLMTCFSELFINDCIENEKFTFDEKERKRKRRQMVNFTSNKKIKFSKHYGVLNFAF